MDELVEDDYLSICRSLYPSIPRSLLSKLILFNKRLYEETMIFRKFAQDGSPWEFNLRDVIRSCQIVQGIQILQFYFSFFSNQLLFNKMLLLMQMHQSSRKMTVS